MGDSQKKRTVAFEVVGQPAPWAVWAKKGPPPPGYEHMMAWRAQIQLAARKAWGTGDPLSGPVRLSFAFYLRQRKGREQEPDLCNLAKAAEDSIQGIIIKNDRQTIHMEVMKQTYDAPEGKTIVWVQAVGP